MQGFGNPPGASNEPMTIPGKQKRVPSDPPNMRGKGPRVLLEPLVLLCRLPGSLRAQKMSTRMLQGAQKSCQLSRQTWRNMDQGFCQNPCSFYARFWEALRSQKCFMTIGGGQKRVPSDLPNSRGRGQSGTL